jgi:hypothetical protein
MGEPKLWMSLSYEWPKLWMAYAMDGLRYQKIIVQPTLWVSLHYERASFLPTLSLSLRCEGLSISLRIDYTMDSSIG